MHPLQRQALASVTVTALLVIVILSGPKAWAQGPPYQTDDPVPVDLHHYEFYVFGAADGTPVEMDLLLSSRVSLRPDEYLLSCITRLHGAPALFNYLFNSLATSSSISPSSASKCVRIKPLFRKRGTRSQLARISTLFELNVIGMSAVLGGLRSPSCPTTKSFAAFKADCGIQIEIFDSGVADGSRTAKQFVNDLQLIATAKLLGFLAAARAAQIVADLLENSSIGRGRRGRASAGCLESRDANGVAHQPGLF